jgi:hypothetical protein
LQTKNKFDIENYFNKISLYVVFLILVILVSSLFFFLNNEKEEQRVNLGDHVIESFRTGLNYEKVDLLSFSMALSEDGELKNALGSDDESKGYKILSNITQRFKKYTHLKSLRIQVLTPDFFIFSRSWDEGFEGMPIWWFRDDLDELIRSSEPKVGMETGRLLTFKATVPIRSGYKILGYLEVIKLVDQFATKLRDRGIELFALMDESYMDKAELMRDFPRLHNYVISNQNFNKQLLKNIRKFDWKSFTTKSYMYEDHILYLYEPMYNGKGKQIGMYLLAIADDALKKFETEDESISLFTQFSEEDIKKVVNAWENPHGSFRNQNDKELIELLPKLQKEDKKELELEAKSVLRTYNKEELIDIVLENKHKEQKIGDIQ